MNTKSLPEDEDVLLPVVYVTTYALTKGILVYRDARECLRRELKDGEWVLQKTGMIDVYRGRGYHNYFHSPDWHKTEEAARIRVEIMRGAKRKSLEKALAKLDLPVRIVEAK